MEYRDADGFTGRGTEFTEGRAFGTGAAPPVRSTGAEKLGLEVGDRVVHDRSGRVWSPRSKVRARTRERPSTSKSTARSSWSSL